MNVQSRRSYPSGFTITEAELRKLLEIIREQFAKLGTSAPTNTSITVDYAGGAKAECQNIEEILATENYGSSRIVDLRIATSLSENAKLASIIIRFANPLESHLEPQSAVSLFVEGDSRDWVLITTEAIEERLNKVRTPRLQRWFHNVPTLVYAGLFYVLFLTAFWTRIDRSEPGFPESYPELSDQDRNRIADEFESAIKTQNITDPISALVKLEHIRADNRRDPDQYKKRVTEWQLRRENWQQRHKPLPFAVYITLITLIPVGLVYLLSRFVRHFYPAYNFSWGDYVEYLKKRQARGNFILVVIVIGIIVSVVGGVIANWLPH